MSALGGPPPLKRLPSLNSETLTGGLGLLSRNDDPVAASIDKMASSPFKKQMEVPKDASGTPDLSRCDYVELEVLVTSKLNELNAMSMPGADVNMVPRAPKSQKSGGGRRKMVPIGGHSSDENRLPDAKQAEAILKQVREGQALFKASVREVSLQLGLHCPERARLVSKTFDFYHVLLSKVQPFIEALDEKARETKSYVARIEADNQLRQSVADKLAKSDHSGIIDPADWSATVKGMLKTLLTTSQKLRAVNVELQAAQEEISTGKSEQGRTRAELENERQTVAHLEAQLKETTQSSEDAATVHASEVAALKAEVETLAEKLRVAQGETDQAVTSRVEEYQAQQKAAQAEVAEQARKDRMALVECKAELSRSQKEMEELTRAMTQSKNQCVAAVTSMRTAACALNIAHSGCVSMSLFPAAGDDAEGLPSTVAQMAEAVGVGIDVVSKKAEAATVEAAELNDKAAYTNERLSQAEEEVEELRTRVQLQQNTISNAQKVIPMQDVEVQATGTGGCGYKEIGVQTWGAKWEDEDTVAAAAAALKAKQEPDIGLILQKDGDGGLVGHLPMNVFMTKYLQRRFGLLETNAEWELGRLRKALGKVLDVYVKEKLDGDDDEEEQGDADTK